MGRWTVFLYLLIFYRHTTSQPVTDGTENARPSRQLDFGECCPCPSAGQSAPHDFAAQDFSKATGEGSFSRARNLDDCPCRDRHPDAEGASSIFFPTSMRSNGPVLRENDISYRCTSVSRATSSYRPVEKKEDLKPLLHPEVDLASSVLQTLREATDEEYMDALARDATRSMAKAAEETTFGDATPEASTGNIVTIIVNPKQTDSLDDVIPQESHVQESRCIYGPLESEGTDFGKMRVASKPPSLLRDFFGLPRLNKPAGLLSRNLLDMDSSSGASNIQEQVVHVDEGRDTNDGMQGLRKYAPLMKLDSRIQNHVTNMKSNVNKDFSLHKVPDVKWSMKNKLKDLLSSRPSLGDIGKISPTPLIPKLKYNNSLSKMKGKDIEDLSGSPSIIQDQAAKRSFFNTKSHLDNIFEKHRPVGLKNLLKLKDVELIPLKDIVHKAADRPKLPKFNWPTIFNKENNLIPINKNNNISKEPKATEITETSPLINTVPIIDHEFSPSNIVEQIHDEHCSNGAIKITIQDTENVTDKIPALEVIDTVPSPSEIHIVSMDKPTDLSNSRSDEFIENSGDCDIDNSPAIETNPSQSKQSPPDAEIQEDNPDEVDTGNSNEDIQELVEEQQNRECNDVLNEEDCDSNNNIADSITDSSINVNDVLEQNETVPKATESLADQTIQMDQSCSSEQEESGNSKTLDSNSETTLIKPLSLDETMSSIKENIIKKIDNLKNRKAISRNSNTSDQKSLINDIKNTDDTKTDCQNEESIETTPVKPEISNDDLENVNETSNNISMQDLQKISDSMLQQEARERKSKAMECLLSNKITEVPLDDSTKETERTNFEEAVNTQYEVVMDPKKSVDVDDKNENNAKNTCQSSLTLSKPNQTDTNFEASDAVVDKIEISESKNIIESPFLKNGVVEPQEHYFNLFKSGLPTLQDVFKPAPLPTLDDIKQTLTSLFHNDKNARDVEVFTTSEADAMTDITNILNPIMATDASTTNFRTSLPPLRLEDVDLDIFQLKPQSGLLSKIPKIDLHSYKTKLSLPKSLRLKPIKLQSAFEDKGNMLGATLTVGRNNVQPSLRNHKITRVSDNLWEKNLNLDDFLARMKSSTQKTATSLELPKLKKGAKSHTFETRFSKPTIKPVNLESHDILEAISRNHEDVNDKLKALHMDFNDRIETLRNNLFDKSRLGISESRNRKTNIKSLTSSTNQDRGKGLSLQTGQPKRVTGKKDSKKNFTPRTLDHLKQTGIGSSKRLSNQKTFKMPASASVPVPRTIEVPELRSTLQKSPGLLKQRTSGLDPSFQNIGALQDKESSATVWKQANKKLPNINSPLGKHINPFKDSKIKVTFSTTPRPRLAMGIQSGKISTPSSHLVANSERTLGRFQPIHDHNGSPSEIRQSIISPISPSQQNKYNLLNSAMVNERNIGRLYEEPRSEEQTRTKLEVENKPRKSNDLQSWPKVSESAFLSKVKEAVRARLVKVNPPITLKQSKVQSGVERSPFSENEEVLNTDMARSASENIVVTKGQTLKENVSYKCTMVCTKE